MWLFNAAPSLLDSNRHRYIQHSATLHRPRFPVFVGTQHGYTRKYVAYNSAVIICNLQILKNWFDPTIYQIFRALKTPKGEAVKSSRKKKFNWNHPKANGLLHGTGYAACDQKLLVVAM